MSDILVNGETQVYGIIGYPVRHSKSPQFQTAAFQALGINAVYLPFQVRPEDLQKAIEGIKALSIKGINVTVPHKEEVIKYLDEVSEEVKYIGACNTVKNIDGYLQGFNTDAYGFIEGLKELTPDFADKKFLVIGAGGASRAVVYGLIKSGVQKIILANRTVKKAEEIVSDFKKLNRFIEEIIEVIPLNQIENHLKEVDVIVNTTSIGLKDDDPPLFDYSKIEKRHIIVDIIYKKTKLLQAAEEKGCLYQDGLPMLLYQGARAFEIWTGQKAPVEVMREILSK
ncbi:shikimate dehydrogenase [Persephonella sp. KM09-Lau-8]|uniref:shikimate dehydrogenase n=1 Tax=Persephonella sp. KM09-Lau-8 TaxID=1158345 RepID=UPI000496390B|nr:shikimate dehydrogenase [Persephonella sp. KM09-Lau-8]